MELSNEQMNNLIFKITEKVLLRMPEILGNLIKEQAAIQKLTKKYYEENPLFKDHVLTVRTVLEKLESENTAMDYPKLLTLAKDKIYKQINLSKDCDIKNIKKLDELNLTSNGEI